MTRRRTPIYNLPSPDRHNESHWIDSKHLEFSIENLELFRLRGVADLLIHNIKTKFSKRTKLFILIILIE